MSESGAAADSHPGVQFHEHLNLRVWRPLGILDEAMIDDIIECIKAKEDKVGKPFNRFTDLSVIDAIDLHFKYVLQVALHRRLSYLHHPPLKSAFYVTSPTTAHYVKIYALICDHSPLRIEMFKERAAAPLGSTFPSDSLINHAKVTGKERGRVDGILKMDAKRVSLRALCSLQVD
jgi:hypothetical protein